KKQTIDYGLAFKAGEVSPTGRSAKGRKLASISRSKVFDSLYLSGELNEEDYREVGRAPVKDVYPVDIDLEKYNQSQYISDTMNITNDIEQSLTDDESEEQEELEESE